MKAKIHIFFVFLLLSSISSLAAYKIDIYNAYLNQDMTKWKTVIDQMEKKTEKTDKLRLQIVNYQYGYIVHLLEKKKDDEVKKYLELARKHLEELEKTKSNSSQVNAYKAIFYGFEISLSTWKAAILGPKSLEAAKQAIEDDPTNANAYILYGHIQRMMPSAFGGSVEEGMKNYKKALTLMEKKPILLKSDWYYLALLKSIGKTYEEMDDYKSAKQYYEKALKKEPNFKEVKETLLPNVKKKLKKE